MSDDKDALAFRRAVMLARLSNDDGMRRTADSIWKEALVRAREEFAKLHPELSEEQLDIITHIFELVADRELADSIWPNP